MRRKTKGKQAHALTVATASTGSRVRLPISGLTRPCTSGRLSPEPSTRISEASAVVTGDSACWWCEGMVARSSS